jgi:hypothetical protein
MICYLGAHYVAFFRNLESDFEYDLSLTDVDSIRRSKLGYWTLYDDMTVKDYPDWGSVVKICIEGLIKPTVLFY